MEERMSDAANTSNQDGDNNSGATSTANDGFKPVTSQDDLNRIVTERVNRERAKFADYNDVKEKAARLDALEAEKKTEAEKAAERLAAIEERATKAERRAIRSEIATEFSLSVEDAKALEHVESEEGMREIAQRLADKATRTKKNNNVVPREGNTNKPAEEPMRDFARTMFGRND
jgi:hypothetical protein